MTPDLVVLGNLIVDDLVFDTGTTRMGEAGGAVIYVALGATLWNARVGIVSLAGSDYPGSMLDALQARGIALEGVRPLEGPGLRVWLLYEPESRRLIHRLGRPSHAEASPGPGDIPPPWLKAPAIHLAPAPLEIQSVLIRELAGSTSAQLSIDPHTPVVSDTFDDWRPVLEGIDVFFASESELQMSAPATEPGESLSWPRATIDSLCRGRLRSIAVKRGERGGTFYAPPAAPLDWLPRATRIVDPTGAGDAFAGAFLAARQQSVSVEQALRRAVVTASFAMEDWGPAGLLAATREAVQERLDDWFPRRD